MASRADLAAHHHERNPNGCVGLPLPMGEARCPFLQRHQGRKSVCVGEISIELHRSALIFNGKLPLC